MNRISLSCILVGLWWSIAVTSAQTPITYQGQLKDAGNPANGTYDFQFALFDASSGGAQVGATIAKPGGAVTNGVFSAELDFGSAAFNGAARWLEVSVRLAGSAGAFTTLAPRQR